MVAVDGRRSGYSVGVTTFELPRSSSASER